MNKVLRTFRLASALALVAGATVIHTTPASAAPTNCVTSSGYPSGAKPYGSALCTAGGGTYRVVLTCTGAFGIGRTTYYGPYRAGAPGSGSSIVECGSFYDSITYVGIQKNP